jgi:RNA polymerase-binding transcription factor DksA
MSGTLARDEHVVSGIRAIWPCGRRTISDAKSRYDYIMDDELVREWNREAARAAELRVAALSAELGAIELAAVDANGDDEHDPEGATVAFERARIAALRCESVAHLAALDRALLRVASGMAAVCDRCGSDIALERLAALPATTTCFRCANATMR